MIKRSITSAVLLTGLLCSAAAFAEAAPTCDSDTFNMVIVNKDLPSDDCYSADGVGEYCIYDPTFDTAPEKRVSCGDQKVALWEYAVDSISVHKTPKHAELTFQVYTKRDKSSKVLRFDYDSPTSYRDNCSSVFGGDVSCVLSKSSIGKRMTYKLVISKASTN